ncbi:hypothetical protein [Polyangium fumosum]|uniref:Transcription factor zinc-finger domain-containing protein n=1 Tax=Polyangium fumosum TaxID=889272 RepID=A0A4U1JHA9_9BACT|nr:hypothetical protein [Polyangium fumosum]TKD09806.1 hypothetical protein E8A74_11650 [Polyangium fumosum]
MTSQIPCPNCGTPIVIDANLLLAGKRFSCTGCDATVALGAASIPTVSHAVDEFNALRRRIEGGGAR